MIGRLLTLRPLQAGDFEELYAAAADPLIWELHPQSNRYQREVFKNFFELAMSSGGAFAIFDNADNKIIGSSRFYAYDAEKDAIAIGYTFLSRKYWGGEFNRELKALMLKHAFQFVQTAVFEIGESNLRSRRAIEKIGGVLVGQAVLDGKAHVVYQISASSSFLREYQ